MPIHFNIQKFTLLNTLIFLLIVLSACSDTDSSSNELRLTGTTMGTSYSIVIPSPPNNLGPEFIQYGVEAELQKINQKMSTYMPDSDLSILNKAEANQWLPVSEPLFSVISYAQSLSKITDGAFDITIGPLVNLWGFGPLETLTSANPSAKDIDEIKQTVGYTKLEINIQNKSLKKLSDNIYIDLSGIAKGYGVDAIAAYLDTLKLQHYLIEIGGEIKSKGKSARGDNWRIALERPDMKNNEQDRRSVQKIISISNLGVATSGDYRNYYEQDGIRYSHTIDPNTGYPVKHNLASVTVLTSDTMSADAWATVLMVLGERKGFEVAEANDVAAYFIYRDGDSFLTMQTKAFSTLTKE